MSAVQLEIQAIAVLAALACALPGVFLVLRRMSLMSDAISHSILLGIVLAFFVTRTIQSPLLIVGAALTGVATVWLVEVLTHTRLVREDAAIGLVFPVLFSIAVILISRLPSGVHLDGDVVLLGELAFAPYERWFAFGWDLGPKSMWMMSIVLLLNTAFVVSFFKELKVATFDPGLAAAIGISPVVVHYALMSVVSVTAVAAFDAVGAVLVVALMIAPPSTAYLLTDRLRTMLVLSAAASAVSAVAGFWVAHWLDASIAGSMATAAGVLFAIALLFAPERGLIAAARLRERQRWEFAHTMLAIHLFNHEGSPDAEQESGIDHLGDSLRWDGGFRERVVAGASRRGLIERSGEFLRLTDAGRDLARRAVVG
jgi:manganese/zinc/iron transport system permease protein